MKEQQAESMLQRGYIKASNEGINEKDWECGDENEEKIKHRVKW